MSELFFYFFIKLQNSGDLHSICCNWGKWEDINVTRHISTVYHGTNLFAANLIKQYGVRLEAQRLFTDFGKGFYVTFNRKQAMRWANVRANNLQVSARLLKILNIHPSEYLKHPLARIPAIMEFDLDLNQLLKLKGKIFPLPSQHNWEIYKKSWEDFVLKCRKGKPHSYDFVYGPIAGGHFKYLEKIQVSKTKEQISLNSYSAIACLNHLQIFVGDKEDVRENKSVPLLHKEIKNALVKISGLKKEHADNMLPISWVASLHPSILATESPYYWAFCLLEGRKKLWHDDYEKCYMENCLS